MCTALVGQERSCSDPALCPEGSSRGNSPLEGWSWDPHGDGVANIGGGLGPSPQRVTGLKARLQSRPQSSRADSPAGGAPEAAPPWVVQGLGWGLRGEGVGGWGRYHH